MTRDAVIHIAVWTRTYNPPFGAWQIMSASGYDRHISEPLGALLMSSATWNLTYYTYRLKVGNDYCARVWFGNSSHYTNIQNFSYDTSTDFPIGIGGGLILGGSMGLIVLLAVAKKKRR